MIMYWRWVLIVLLCSATAASGYGRRTHAAITYAALQQSSVSARLGDLGLGGINDSLVQYCFEFNGTDIAYRGIDPYEAERMIGRPPETSIAGWMVRGAIREDDVSGGLGCVATKIIGLVDPSEIDCNPADDPFTPSMDRVLNHFFDPTTRAARSSSDVAAPTWALGVVDPFSSGPNEPDTSRQTNFSLIDARRAMYYALSGVDAAGRRLDGTDRAAYWATTFRALGDAAHLIEDMAQPQHTRPEAHPFSVYERYIDGRARFAERYRIDGITVSRLAGLTFGEYPDVKFDRYSDYWGARDINTPIQDRTGLADYSNRSFFSEHHNFGDSPYILPSSVRSDYGVEAITDPSYQRPNVTSVFLTVSAIHDPLTNVDSTVRGTSRPRMTTESSLNVFLADGVLARSEISPTYSLNRFNFDDQAELLVPRATGYAAGLLDYFFRGKIDCVLDVTLVSGCRIRNLGSETLKNGYFELYYEAQDGLMYMVNRWPTPDPGLSPSDPLDPTDGLAIQFDPPTSPAPLRPGKYVLVFHGDMGQETADSTYGDDGIGAVAGKVVKLDSGALYVLLGTVYGSLQTFRVDADGTRALSGGETDPFQFWEQWEYTYYWGLLRYRWNSIYYAAYDKQVQFGSAPAVYRMISARTVVPNGFGFEIDGWFATDQPPNGLKRVPGFSWYARDLVAGVFTLTAPDFKHVNFARTFWSNGTLATASGSVAITNDPNNPYTISKGISPDGTISNAINAISSANYFVLTLGAAPTGNFVPASTPIPGMGGLIGPIPPANQATEDPNTLDWYFRGVDLGPDAVFDNSPLGEPFAATSDGSIIFHESINNRMPKFVMPAGYSRIVGAMWL